MTEAHEERIARNDAAFRDANEGIAVTVRETLDPAGRLAIPFLCECADTTCTQLIRVPLDEYAEVRAHPRRFITARGHERSFAARVVAERDGYTVVEKIRRAGEVAERLA